MADSLIAGTQISTVRGSLTDHFQFSQQYSSGSYNAKNLYFTINTVLVYAPLVRCKIHISPIIWTYTVSVIKSYGTLRLYVDDDKQIFYSDATDFNVWTTVPESDYLLDTMNQELTFKFSYTCPQIYTDFTMSCTVQPLTIDITYYPL